MLSSGPLAFSFLTRQLTNFFWRGFSLNCPLLSKEEMSFKIAVNLKCQKVFELNSNLFFQMCALLQSADKRTVSKCLVQLSIFLCHKFPRIRKFTAAKLFEAILTYSDREIVPDENLDEVRNITCLFIWVSPTS